MADKMQDYIEDVNKQRKEKYDKEFLERFGISSALISEKFLYDLEGLDKKAYEGLQARYKKISYRNVFEVDFILDDGQKYLFPKDKML